MVKVLRGAVRPGRTPLPNQNVGRIRRRCLQHLARLSATVRGPLLLHYEIVQYGLVMVLRRETGVAEITVGVAPVLQAAVVEEA